jgi:8-hydroxy-5-deazaflavin:NADPH oxidoreductase
MKIGIIGSGHMGSALGRIWGRNGHDIMFSSRHPAELEGLARSTGSNAGYGTPQEAARFGDVILLSVPWGQAGDVLRTIVPLDGKVLIDCTNPLKKDLSGLELGQNTSAAEEVARRALGASVVKAFNTVFADVISSSSRMFGGHRATGFYCGDDHSAKAVVSKLIDETGLEPVDCGPLHSARYLEPMTGLLLELAAKEGMGTNMSITLLRR